MYSSHNNRPRPSNCMALIFALLLAFHSAEASQQPDASPAAAVQTWRISGKVIDPRSGQPVARCVVEINRTDNRSQSLSVETGDDGRFDFAGVGLGKYDLSAGKRGYLTRSYQEHEGFSTAIAVGPGLKSEDLIFNLTPQAIFYGAVSDETGEPIRRAQVRLYQDRNLDGIRSTRQRQMVITDDLGMYEIPNVAPGNYFLSVSAQPWYASGVNGVRPPMQSGDVQPGTADSTLDVAYPTIFYPNAIDSDDAIPIPIRGGERIEANMTLTAQHAMRLRLLVAGDQGGHSGVSIAQTVFGQLEPIPTFAQADNEGVVEISGVLPGRYEVTVIHSDGESSQTTHFTTDIADGATQLSTEGGEGDVTVTGKVTSLDSKIRSASISLVGSHPQRAYTARLDEAGEFTLQVVPGEYQVIGQIPQMYLANVSSPNAPVKGRTVEVKAGDAPRLEIVVGAGYGQIGGTVERAGGPTGGVMVLLAPEDAKDNQILFRRDQSDSDGTFSLSDIVPGRYRLLAIDDGWELDWADPNVLAAYLKKSIQVQVRAHDKLKQTVEVQSR
jgi:protocatechuate 3,4-dioxygenase beta subunit